MRRKGEQNLLLDPSFRRFAEKWLDEVGSEIKQSSVTLVLAPTGGIADVKIALELGYTILHDKPIIVIRPPKGRVVSERLLRIADYIVEGDVTTPAGRQEIETKLRAVLKQ